MRKNSAATAAPIYVSILMVLLALSGSLLSLTTNTRPDDVLFSAIILELFIYMIPAAFWCRIRGLDFIEASGAKLFAPSNTPFILSAFFVYAFGSMFLLFLSVSPDSSSTTSMALELIDEADSALISLCYVVIPAISEEMLFRSILLHEYREWKGMWALTITSLFFAMLHFSFSSFIYFFWGGFMLGLLTLVTHSSIPAIILHMISNFVTLYFSDTISNFLSSVENSVVLVFLLSVFFLLSLYFLASTLQTLYEKKSEEYDEGTLKGSRIDAIKKLSKAGRLEKSKKPDIPAICATARDMFLSPTVLIAICVFVFIALDVI